MNFIKCYVFLFAMCGFSGVLAKRVRLQSRHHLIKRQADYSDQNSHTDSSNSDQDGTPSSSGRRHFVSPDGEPYYEYQPHVSTSRGSSSGGRSATSHVRIGGQGRSASVPAYSSEVRRSRTYTYPFGRGRTQYVEQQQQSESGSSQTYGSAVETEGAAVTGSAVDTGRSGGARGQYYSSRSRGYSQGSHYSSSNQRAATSSQDSSRQTPSDQQSDYDAEQEEARRRHAELRRQHEEERQRRLEERRRREDERRRHEEERRRLEEERRVLEEERRRESEARRRQHYGQDRQYQQQTQPTTTTEATTEEDSDETTTTPVYRGGSRNRQSYPRYSQQRGTSSQHQSVSGQPTSQQGIYDSAGQSGVYRTSYGQQTGSYTPTNQQRGVYRTNSQRQQTYYPQTRQQPVYSSVSRTVTSQEPVYRSSSTTYRQGSQTYPGQQSHVFYQQPGQVDPRLVATQGGTYPGFRTQYEYSSGSQGQSQGQGYYNSYNNPFYVPGDTGVGSVLPYGTNNAFSECPDTGLVLRINGMSCEQAIQQHGSYLCYAHEYTSRECCEVCRPLKQASRIGCEYGDHAELCSEITPSDCYDLRNRQSCCESCERFRRDDAAAGCEYGDMTVRCEDVRQNPGLCYIPDNQRLCCETCNRIRNSTNPSCPWGDYNSNLCQVFDDQTSGVRINCYSPQRRRMCCESCERLRTWLPNDLPADCQYGDRPVIFSTGQFGRLNCSNIFSVFSTEECRTNRAVSVNCCHTCHRYLRGRG